MEHIIILSERMALTQAKLMSPGVAFLALATKIKMSPMALTNKEITMNTR